MPPPKLTVSEWADRYRVLSQEVSPEPGRFDTSRTPYLREIMDVMGDDEHEDVCWVSCTQVGKTTALENVLGYTMSSDPSGMLMVFPRDKDVKTFSKERLTPMIRDTPKLRGLVKASERRHSDDTLERKVFPGGFIAMGSSRSPADLAARPVRRLLGDEVDRWIRNTGKEGSPWELGKKRTQNFWNRKRAAVSSPTEKDLSLIDRLWQESDQRRYHVECPDCGHSQPLRWKDDNGQYHLVCEKDEHGELIPETARYRCAACEYLIPENHKRRMLAGGQWVATYPHRKAVGFHLNALYSPWVTWAEVMNAFIAAKGSQELLQTFVNTWLAETFAVSFDVLDPSSLAARAEPPDVLWPHIRRLTAGLDVQSDRVEILIVGWGERERSFLLEVHQVWGDPQADTTWDEVDALLWPQRNGLPISFACVDSSYLPAPVWRWANRPANRRRVAPINGMSGRGRPPIAKPALAKTRDQRKPWLVGTDTVKDLIALRLRSAVPSHGSVQFSTDLPMALYDQLTAEVSVPVTRNGRAERAWKKVDEKRANEGLDMFGYAIGALYRQGARSIAALNTDPAAVVAAPTADRQADAPPPQPLSPAEALYRQAMPRPSKQKGFLAPRSGWVNGWRK
jgi:phage terminase large subunit GpA-like protein